MSLFKWIFFPLQHKTYNIHYILDEKISDYDYNFLVYLTRLCCDNIITNDSAIKTDYIKYDSTLDIHTICQLRKNPNNNVTLLLNMDLLLGDPTLPLDYPIKNIFFNLFHHGILEQPQSTFHLISYGKYRHHFSFYYDRMDQTFFKNFDVLQKFITTYYFWKKFSLQLPNNSQLIYHIHSYIKDFNIQYLNIDFA